MTREEFLRAGPLPPAERLILLSWALGLDRGQIYLHPRETIPAGALRRVHAAVRRRCAGDPLPYITGEAFFWSMKLRVGPGVLVPRPETETLVEEAVRRAPEGGLVADIGTGSGAIALALSTARPDLRITAVERSRRALRYARQNLGPKVTLVEGDLLRPITEPQDVIVANPPYISEGEMRSLPADVLREPRAALYGGPDGLDLYRRLAAGAPRRLRSGGWLLVEIGAAQGDTVPEIFAREGLRELFVRQDLAGRDRVVGGRAG